MSISEPRLATAATKKASKSLSIKAMRMASGRSVVAFLIIMTTLGTEAGFAYVATRAQLSIH